MLHTISDLRKPRVLTFSSPVTDFHYCLLEFALTSVVDISSSICIVCSIVVAANEEYLSLRCGCDQGEKTMQIQEQTTEAIIARPMLPRDPASTKTRACFASRVESNASTLGTEISRPGLFDYIARTTFAERYPLLTLFAISFGLMACALMTEVECLKGSGYFWP